jgi:hypothetical protein
MVSFMCSLFGSSEQGEQLTQIHVIGAGFPRTGTLSLKMASNIALIAFFA